jgi:hypothetical protein
MCEVILCGDEYGVTEVASAYGVKHLRNIKCNEYGTPLLSSVFDHVQRIAKHNLICYVNTDIIFLSDLLVAIQRVSFSRFLLAGQRWDMNVTAAIDFNRMDWEQQFRNNVQNHGKLHPPSGSDYFIFPKRIIGKLPDFAVGRPVWDNWFIYKARAQGIPVIDATQLVMAVHQNHDYAHIQAARDGVSWEGPEADRNRAIIGNPARVFTLWDANWLLTPQGLLSASTTEHLDRAKTNWYILHPNRSKIRRVLSSPRRLVAILLHSYRSLINKRFKVR